MEEVARKNRNPFVIALVAVVIVFVAVPLAVICLSFVGRVSPEAVLPDTFVAYVRVPDVMRFADRLLAHESLPDILAEPAAASFAPAIARIRDSALTERALARFIGNGNLEGAVLGDGRVIAAYDMGVVSPLMALAPFVAGRITGKNLYYVQAGGISRFEYRPEGGAVWYIAPYHNLLVVTNDAALIESALRTVPRAEDVPGETGTAPAADSLTGALDANGQRPSPDTAASVDDSVRLARRLGSDEYDIGFLVDSRDALAAIANGDEAIRAVVAKLDVSDTLALTVRIKPRELDVTLRTRLESKDPDLRAILSKDSPDATIAAALPSNAQYATLITGIPPERMLAALKSASPQAVGDSIDRADRTASSMLGMGFDSLIYSWAGDGLAVFGLEGRPRPVFALKVADEAKRKAAFDAVIATFAVTEDDSFVIDGVRVPRLKLPDFLAGLLGLFKVSVPAPYYLVENGWLYLSESPENLLSTVTAIRKGDTLKDGDTWKLLSASSGPKETLSLFYSLDRAIPFFLKGHSSVTRALRLYRQGLARLSIEDGEAVVTLAVIPGEGSGVMPLPGYPVELGGRAGDAVYSIGFSSGHSSRLVTVVDKTRVLALDTATLALRSFDAGSPAWCVPAPGLAPEKPEDNALWVVTESGEVSLMNGNLEIAQGFPVSVGVALSARPVADGDRILLPASDGSLRLMDRSGKLGALTLPFTEELRSPPVIASSLARRVIAAYPKGFSGMLWLMDATGAALPGWPIPAGGIAFGSPVPCETKRGLELAFLTQSGTLSRYTESGQAVKGYPVSLPGVFFFQPAFDGEFLWAVSSSGILYRVAPDGAVMNRQIPDFTATAGAIACADIDGDKAPEVLVSGDGNALFAYRGDFTPLDGFPLPIWGLPAIAELNGDGSLECAGVGLDNRLYCWQFRKKKGN
jgi:hypothetical protein